MKHKFQNPLIKQIVRHLIEMDRTEFQTVQEFMEDLGVVLEPVIEGNFAREAMKESARREAPVRTAQSAKWGEAPAFRADVLDKVARGVMHEDDCEGCTCD